MTRAASLVLLNGSLNCTRYIWFASDCGCCFLLESWNAVDLLCSSIMPSSAGLIWSGQERVPSAILVRASGGGHASRRLRPTPVDLFHPARVPSASGREPWPRGATRPALHLRGGWGDRIYLPDSTLDTCRSSWPGLGWFRIEQNRSIAARYSFSQAEADLESNFIFLPTPFHILIFLSLSLSL
jgi:hypothetical protein